MAAVHPQYNRAVEAVERIEAVGKAIAQHGAEPEWGVAELVGAHAITLGLLAVAEALHGILYTRDADRT